jgi:hypothetical protein
MTLRRTARRSGAFIFVAENQSPLLQIVGRYFYSHAIPGQGFDPISFHSSCGVGDELVSVIELNAVTSVGQYLGYQTLELQQFFLGHVMFLVNDQPDACACRAGWSSPYTARHLVWLAVATLLTRQTSGGANGAAWH